MKAAGRAVLLAMIAATALAQHPNDERGFSPGRVYSFHGIDSVNQYNGNLNVRLPLGPALSVSDRLAYQTAVTYNSHLWEFEQRSNYYYSYPRGEFNAGLGWRLSLGTLQNIATDGPYEAGFRYLDSSGATHAFYNQLHGEASSRGTLGYSRDGSYLRLRYDGIFRNVEFPDGSVYVFSQLQPQMGSWPYSLTSGVWCLTEMRDAYGNRASVFYERTSEYKEIWTVVDNYRYVGSQPVGRTVKVYLRESPSSYFENEVDSVDVTGGDGSTVRYRFSYQDIRVKPGPGDDYPRGGDGKIPVRVLTAVTPQTTAGSALDPGFSMIKEGAPAYETELPTPGALVRLTLPTLGSINWTYDVRQLSPSLDRRYSPTIQHLSSVSTRYTCDPATQSTCSPATAPTWTYGHAVGGLSVCQAACPESGAWCSSGRARQLTAWLVEPAGAGSQPRVTVNYFSAYAYIDDPDGDTCTTSPEGWLTAEQGLPFTRFANDGDGRFLSSEVRLGWSPADLSNWQGSFGALPDTEHRKVESTYVRYRLDSDAAISNGVTPGIHNAQTETSATYYDADRDAQNQPYWKKTNFRNFDGYGHFRQTSTDGNFPDGGNFRTTFVNHNAAPTETSWMLETSSEQCSADESAARTGTISSCTTLTDPVLTRTQYDARGSLVAKRILAGSALGVHDLLATYEYDARGTLIRERYYGGDVQVLPVSEAFSTPSTGPQYTIAHTPRYEHSMGRITNLRSTYSNGVVTRDEDYDGTTGLLTASRDGSGLATTYAYDALRRIVSAQTPGEIAATYTYTNASGGTARARVRAVKGSSVAEYIYDGLGRLWREKTRQPGASGAWSIVQTTYDAAGHAARVSMPETLATTEESFVPAKEAKYTNFDWSGQARTVETPDGKTTTVTRTGVRLVDRQSAIVTSTSGTETPVTVREVYDGRGRLVRVEDAMLNTRYAYDASDRLRSVTMNDSAPRQSRLFNYDNRGFLLWEQHPELGTTGNGSIAYSNYDARGHAGRKITGPDTSSYDLEFTWDASERLVLVTDADPGSTATPRPRRPLKQFIFADANDTVASPIDYRKDRLLQALRVNRLPSSTYPVVVTETYKYQNGSGRVSERTTRIDEGPTTLQGGNISVDPLNTPREFRQSFLYDTEGSLTRIDYPTCVVANACPGTPALNLTQSFSARSLTSVGTFATMTYNANGSVRTVNHGTNGGAAVLDEYLNEPDLMARQTKIRFSGWQSCAAPTPPAVTASSAVCASSTGNTASVPHVAGHTYSWSIADGTITAGRTSSQVTYSAGASGSVALAVTVSNGCGTATGSKSVTISPVPTATVSGSITIMSGGSATIRATLTGTAPWTLTWSDGYTQSVGASPATRTVAPGTTTTYTVTSLAGDGCANGTSSGRATVTVTDIPPPAVITARTNTSSTRNVNISWPVVTHAVAYRVERATVHSGPWSTILDDYATNAWTDTLAPSERPVTYLYRVRSIDASGNVSPPGPLDYATTATTLFSGVASRDFIQGAHIRELRMAVDAVRYAAGLGPYTAGWTTDYPTPTGSILASHWTTLRTALDQATVRLVNRTVPYTDEIPASGGTIYAYQMQQAQDGVR